MNRPPPLLSGWLAASLRICGFAFYLPPHCEAILDHWKSTPNRVANPSRAGQACPDLQPALCLAAEATTGVTVDLQRFAT